VRGGRLFGQSSTSGAFICIRQASSYELMTASSSGSLGERRTCSAFRSRIRSNRRRRSPSDAGAAAMFGIVRSAAGPPARPTPVPWYTGGRNALP
jgi:hypothetical protein